MAGEHNFGGEWTAKKLEIIGKYLDFYSTALSSQSFRIHYVDPFSGSGRIDTKGELLELDPIKGSATQALQVARPFFKYHFNEPNTKRYNQLKQTVDNYPSKNVSLTKLDANIMIQEVCKSLGQDRAIFFIDPYGCQLEWESLSTISNGAGNDVWLWFPTSAVMRQATVDKENIQDSWRKRLDKLFGDNGWERALYAEPADEGVGIIEDMFGAPLHTKSMKRERGSKALDSYVMEKLESIFPYVNPKSMPFTNRRGTVLFQLYFAMSNNRRKALELAKKGVRSILK